MRRVIFIAAFVTFVFGMFSCASGQAASEEEGEKAKESVQKEEEQMKKEKAEAEKKASEQMDESKKKAETEKKMAEEKLGTIVDVAKGAGSFNTLVTAVKAAGLAETLSGEGPFTVFAPTDKAFKALPEGTLDSLLKSENKSKLQSILKYHVIKGKVMAADVESGKVETLEGAEAEVKVTDDGVTYGGANVTQTDVKASNGVIHVIDKVVMPPKKKETAQR